MKAAIVVIWNKTQPEACSVHVWLSDSQTEEEHPWQHLVYSIT